MSNAPTLLSEVPYGAFLQYSPRGTSAASTRSREWCTAIKNDEAGRIRYVVETLAKNIEARTSGLLQLFGADVALVPAPRSAPLQKGTLWPSNRICEELARAGLGEEVQPCLERVEAVQKSAFARKGDRPTPQVHLASLVIRAKRVSRQRIVIVDDVVTLGATLLAAASLVKTEHPRASVSAFALIRTMGLVEEVDSVVSPCIGRIQLTTGGKAWRTP